MNWTIISSIVTTLATIYIAVFTRKLAKYNQQLLRENREIMEKLESPDLFIMRQGNTFKIINLSKSTVLINAVFACPSNTTLEEVVSFINSSKSAEPYSTSQNAKSIPFELIPIEPLKYQEFNFLINSEKFFLMEKRDNKLAPMKIFNTSNQKQQPKIQERIRLFVLFYYPGGFNKTYIHEALLTGRIPRSSELYPIELNRN